MRSLLLLMLMAVPAGGAAIGPMIEADLDDDGVAETFLLDDRAGPVPMLPAPAGPVDLLIQRNTGEGDIVVPGIVQSTGTGTFMELSLTPEGEVQMLVQQTDLDGEGWTLTLGIVFREDTYRVVKLDWLSTGDIDMVTREPLHPEETLFCSLDLDAGNGALRKGSGPEMAVQTPLRSLPVTEWPGVQMPPEGCSG